MSSTSSILRDPKRALLLGAIACGLIAISSLAHAQELGVSAEIDRPLARTGGDDPTASATDVDARDRPTAIDTLESALREAPGVRPLASGSYGSATTLSLRGADPDQLEVMLGDVPITTADGSAFDLSTIPLWALERVEVYRSGAPTWLGAGAIGGVVRLVLREPDDLRVARANATIGLGSFGLAHGRAGAEIASRDLQWVAAVGVTSSEGSFRYTDDARTSFDPNDDFDRVRENGWVREGSGLAHLRARVDDGTLSAFFFGLDRMGGVPGPASQRTRFARRDESTFLAGLAYELTEEGRPPDRADWRFQIATSAGLRRRRFTDLYNETGLGVRSTDDLSWRSTLRVAASGAALEWLEITGVAMWTHEELLPSDALARAPLESSARDSGTFAIEPRVHLRIDGTRLELRPSARLAVIGSRLVEIRPERAGEESEGLTVAPTFRIAAAIAPIAELTIAASFSSATRAPSAIELFGDRGYLLGDVSLRPERAETVDLGVTLRGRHDVVSGSIEVRGFATFASDLIRYRRTSQYTAVPENVASATMFGGELGVRGAITRHFEIVSALTLLDTRTEYLDRERRLPLRPWMTAYVRPSAILFDIEAADRLELWIDLAHVAESFATPANDPDHVLSARTRFGAGISAYFLDQRLRIDLSAQDLFDARGTDLLGFPLPGRSFAAALSVTAP